MFYKLSHIIPFFLAKEIELINTLPKVKPPVSEKA